MKRILSVVLVVVVLSCAVTASANGIIQPYYAPSNYVQTQISISGGSVQGMAYSPVDTGYHATSEATLQELSNGVWRRIGYSTGGATVVVNGIAHANCSYRLFCTYRIYNSMDDLVETFSCYSAVKTN